MKNKVLSCLGRRKRDSSHTEADLGYGNAAGDPATSRDHRVGKLPRDEVVSAGEAGGFDAPSGLDGNVEALRNAVNREAAAGSSDEVSGAARCEEPTTEREDDASDPQTRAMEEQPLGGDEDRAGPLTGAAVSSDADTQPTLSRLSPDLKTDEGEMTKRGSGSCRPIAAGDQNNGGPGESESRKDPDQPPQGGQSFTGTIPKLIITRDPSPTRTQDTLLTVRTDLSSGSCLDPHPDDESPCSDSGCGGSPALMRSPRKLSNSSSIGLSSASSFEESEDDFTGSDIESSLSPARSLCSPDDGTGSWRDPHTVSTTPEAHGVQTQIEWHFEMFRWNQPQQWHENSKAEEHHQSSCLLPAEAAVGL